MLTGTKSSCITGGNHRSSTVTSDLADISVQQQAIVDADNGFFELSEFYAALDLAKKRLCKVLVDGGDSSKGTGFLVGPQTVLTAWHVVAPLIGADGKSKNKSAKKLSVEFDVSVIGDDSDLEYEAAEDWLLAGSDSPTSFSSGDDGINQSHFLKDAKNLDFALIHLKGTPGGTRGFYRINKSVVPEVGTRLIVCQHPAGMRQRVDISQGIEYLDTDTKTRILHKANTLKGSSGGLCLNQKFEPVALHQFALLDDNDDVVANGGVPTARIAPFLERAEEINPVYSALSILPDAKQPVIGREKFQAAVWEAKLGNKPIMRVWGLQKSGKSFCVRILRAMLSHDENEYVEISASKILPKDTDFAMMVLEQVELPEDFKPLPDRAGAETSDHAWQEQELLQAFLDRLSHAMGNRILWLILDDLERHTLTDSSSRSFLSLLYKHVKAVSCLRIVLVGLDVKVPGADIDLIYSEQTAPFQEGEITKYLGHSFGSKKYPTNKDELGRLSSIIRWGSNDPDDIPAVSKYVRKIIVPALKL